MCSRRRDASSDGRARPWLGSTRGVVIFSVGDLQMMSSATAMLNIADSTAMCRRIVAGESPSVIQVLTIELISERLMVLRGDLPIAGMRCLLKMPMSRLRDVVRFAMLLSNQRADIFSNVILLVRSSIQVPLLCSTFCCTA